MTLRKTNTVHRQDGDSRFPGERVWFWCPGCETHHAFTTKLADGEPTSHPVWDWNGDLESPTFSPSLLVNGSYCMCVKPGCTKPHAGKGIGHRCHLFLRNGMVQFLTDCSHHLAGQTLPVEEPDLG